MPTPEQEAVERAELEALVAIAVPKLAQLSDVLNDFYLEREATIKTMINSLVSRQHNLQLGPPGTGKSALVRSVVKSITDVFFPTPVSPDARALPMPQHMRGRYFEKLVGKAFPVDEILGPMSIKGFEEEDYRRVLEYFLPGSTFAFLDEIYKAGPVLISPTLSIMNERVYTNGSTIVRCPLRVCFAGSNELYEGEGLDAFDARFFLRSYVDYIAEKQNFFRFIRSVRASDEPETEKIDLKLGEIDAVHDYARNYVEWSDDATEMLFAIRESFRKNGLLFDDRRSAWIAKELVPAETVLRGGDRVEAEDFDILAHALWRQPKDRDVVQELVYKVSNPVREEVNRYLDDAKKAINACDELIRNAGNDKRVRRDAGIDCDVTLTAILEKVERRTDQTGGNTRKQFHAAFEKIEQQHEALLLDVLRIGRSKRLEVLA